jgi:hypothetical protein
MGIREELHWPAYVASMWGRPMLLMLPNKQFFLGILGSEKCFGAEKMRFLEKQLSFPTAGFYGARATSDERRGVFTLGS